MNQGSLFQYKQQVYNPGSPNPNPRVSPLKTLPKTLSPYNKATINPNNPLKIVFGSKRKHSDPEPEPNPSPIKKCKIMTSNSFASVDSLIIICSNHMTYNILYNYSI